MLNKIIYYSLHNRLVILVCALLLMIWGTYTAFNTDVDVFLIEEQGVYSVFIRLDEEGYKKQWVTLGANNGSEVQILSGLKPGDEVVTRGAYQIKLSSASNAIPAHSHSH